MLLLNFFVSALEVVLYLQEEGDLLLVLCHLLSHRTVVVMGVAVESHELIERLLQFLLAPFQRIVLAATALEGDLQVLVHLVGREVVFGEFGLVDEDLLAQIVVEFLKLLQPRGEFVVALAHALVQQFVLDQLLLLALHLLQRQSLRLHCLHQAAHLFLLPPQFPLQLPRPFPRLLPRLQLPLQLPRPFVGVAGGVAVGALLLLQSLLEVGQFLLRVPSGVLDCLAGGLLEFSDALLLLLDLLQELLSLLLQVVDLLLQLDDFCLLLPQFLADPLVGPEVLLAVAPVLVELPLQDLLLLEGCLVLTLAEPQSDLQLLDLPADLLCALLGAEVDVAVDAVLLEEGDVGFLFLYDLLDCLRLDVAVLAGTKRIQVLLPLRRTCFGVGRVEAIDEEGESAVDIVGLEVGELLGDGSGRLDLEGDGDEFVLVGRQREGVGREGELLHVVEAEEEVGDGLRGVVHHLHRLHRLTAQLHHLRLHRHRLRTHAVRI